MSAAVTSWRIVKAKHAATAFSGEGARLFGGRFNSKGTTIVYTAGSVSLAAMELLVHLQSSEVLAQYVVIGATFDRAMVKRVSASELPGDWDDSPVPAAVQRFGDAWVASGESAVLEAPSAVIEMETNFLLNPAHTDFARIVQGKPLPFSFDPRVLKS